MADLKTNYVDDVLDTTKNQLRKYQQIQNDDGTVSFVDVTEYTQVGTSFGAKDINDTNAAINDVNRKLSGIKTSEILWENPSPDSNFSAQNIVLSSDRYDYLKVFFRQHNVGDGGCDAQDILKGKGAQLVYATYGGGSPIVCVRKINYVDDVTLSVTAESSSGSVNQGYIVPIKIIGCYL